MGGGQDSLMKTVLSRLQLTCLWRGMVDLFPIQGSSSRSTTFEGQGDVVLKALSMSGKLLFNHLGNGYALCYGEFPQFFPNSCVYFKRNFGCGNHLQENISFYPW